MSTRERATIRKISVGKEDHGIPTVWVHLAGAGGAWGQGFGGLRLDGAGLTRDFVSSLCRALGVADPELLEGREVFVLRCSPHFNATIEGLESIDGRGRFTLTGWRRRHWPETPSTLEAERERLRSRKESLRRAFIDACRDLEKIESEHVDWERP